MPGVNTTLPAPLGHINVHIRDGSAILLHSKPAYTIEETRQGPYSLLVSLSADGKAFGTAFVDDGVSNPLGPIKILSFMSEKGRLQIQPEGSFNIEQRLQDITILGVRKPKEVTYQGKLMKTWIYLAAQEKLVLNEIDKDLNVPILFAWN